MDKINNFTVQGILITRDKNLNQLTINVTVEPFEITNKEIRLTLKDILLYLNEKEIKVKTCIHSSVISNRSENSLLGTWIFEVDPILESKKKIKKKEQE